jgi:hypothetical protein
MVRRIISGGNCGVERAALDAALKNGLKTGGWCVKGLNKTDGISLSRYELKEIGVDDPAKKDELNLRDATGTIVIYEGAQNQQTHQIVELGKKYNKPCLLVNIQNEPNEETEVIMIWLDANKIIQLNVTGPEGDTNSDLYKRSLRLLNKVFLDCKIEDEDDYND